MKANKKPVRRLSAYAGPALIYVLGSALTLFLAGSRWLTSSRRHR